jgi:hypothetical protein
MRGALDIYVIYSVYASVVLVCNTLDVTLDPERRESHAGIKYLSISRHVLLAWAAQCPNCVIFDLHGEGDPV